MPFGSVFMLRYIITVRARANKDESTRRIGTARTASYCGRAADVRGLPQRARVVMRLQFL